jgi:hypothetical protein
VDEGEEIGVCLDVEDCAGVKSGVLLGPRVDEEVVGSAGEGDNEDGLDCERLKT